MHMIAYLVFWFIQLAGGEKFIDYFLLSSIDIIRNYYGF